MVDETTPTRKPRRRWFVALLLAAIFMRQLVVGGDHSKLPSALIGKPAPEFTLAPLEGLKGANGAQVPGFSSAQLKGRVTIVNVWASWCAPCRVEHPLLMELARRDDATLVGINYKDQPSNAVGFLGQLGNPFAEVGVDPNGSAAIDWGVYGVPETFIVNADGIIVYKFVGPLSEESLANTFLPELEKAKAGLVPGS
jgi:cytochrome c biogenesis protein CcmG/thiol:disulfide interchange protein DsbE